jgi:uncharacterized HAD superfamily protein
MINIGIDIDEVVLRYVDRLAEVFLLFGGETDISKPKEFNIYKMIKENEKNKLTQAFAYMMNEELELYQDAKELIKFLIKDGKPIKFITSRNKNLSLDSAAKSIDNFISELTSKKNVRNVYTIDCVVGSKLEKIKEHKIEYFVDDKRETCLELAKNGIFVFMPRRPWNTLPPTENIYQYNNAIEIVKWFN